MSRLSLLLLAATMELVLCQARQAAEAGPVTLGLEAYGELAGATPATEGSSSSTPEEVPAEAKPQPSPQNAMLPSGTTTGSSPSTVTPGGTPPSAITSEAIAYRPTLGVCSIEQPNSLFIPSQSLDGIFHPPRQVVAT